MHDKFRQLERHKIVFVPQGQLGFGFTIAESNYGQKVKKILDRERCKTLQEGDILVAINDKSVFGMKHTEVVQVLKDCPMDREANIVITRKKSSPLSPLKPKGFLAGLYRSKTPTADLFRTEPKEVVPKRPKTPLIDTRRKDHDEQLAYHSELYPNGTLPNGHMPDRPPYPQGYGHRPPPGAFSYVPNGDVKRRLNDSAIEHPANDPYTKDWYSQQQPSMYYNYNGGEPYYNNAPPPAAEWPPRKSTSFEHELPSPSSLTR